MTAKEYIAKYLNKVTVNQRDINIKTLVYWSNQKLLSIIQG